MDTYSLVTLLSLRFRAREERRRVARTIPFSLSLSRRSKNSVTLELFDKTLARREVWS